MSEATQENSNDLSGVPIAERVDAVRERIARRLERPAVILTANLEPPPFEALSASQTESAKFARTIGTVNPRPPGVVNDLLQAVKRSLARALGWIVRPQRDFNEAILESLARTSEVLEATNRNVLALNDAIAASAPIYREIFNQIELLDEKMKLQKWALDGATFRQGNELHEALGKVQEHLWEEMRTLRQRMAALSKVDSVSKAGGTAMSPAQAAISPLPSPSLGIDYFQLERHFRGAEEEIRRRQSVYVPLFKGKKNVLDIACGRGEFLELMAQANIPAQGVDLDTDMIGRCLEKGLNATQSDVFHYLNSIPDNSLDGIFCSQFAEHVETQALLRLLSLCAKKLASSGVLIMETPNPECLAIFSQAFYSDPTHVRPIPPALMRVLFAEAGFQRITTQFLSPVAESLPTIPHLWSPAIETETLRAWNAAVTRFNETFFGGMDYAVIGYRSDSLADDSPAAS